MALFALALVPEIFDVLTQLIAIRHEPNDRFGAFFAGVINPATEALEAPTTSNVVRPV
jgi:hypothetical protein